MIRFALRIPEDLHARLTAQAVADRRSVNSEILHLLEVALATVAPASPTALHEKPDSPQAGGDTASA
jgi:hypothetical protein